MSESRLKKVKNTADIPLNDNADTFVSSSQQPKKRRYKYSWLAAAIIFLVVAGFAVRAFGQHNAAQQRKAQDLKITTANLNQQVQSVNTQSPGYVNLVEVQAIDNARLGNCSEAGQELQSIAGKVTSDEQTDYQGTKEAVGSSCK